MYDLQGVAWRVKSGIFVQLSGLLPNSCGRAEISDKHPGGNISYVIDPGHSEVHIREWSTGGPICLEYLVPWTESTIIPTFEAVHDKVQIFVNGKKEKTLKVDAKLAKMTRSVGSANDILPWKVIALSGFVPSDKPPYFGCSIIPDHAVFPQIFTKVYGPASRVKCEKFVKKNCECLKLK